MSQEKLDTKFSRRNFNEFRERRLILYFYKLFATQFWLLVSDSMMMKRNLRQSVRRSICGSRLNFQGRKIIEREGFGSFHSEDVEKLIRLPQKDFKIPSVCSHIAESTMKVTQVPFGKASKELLFHIDDSWTFINHGAFGGALKPALQEAAGWRQYSESQPLRFYDRDLLPSLAHSVREMAIHLSCPASELYPLQNVTGGLNCVASSIAPALNPGDNILCLSITYGSSKKILSQLSAITGATIQIVHIPLPVQSKEDVISRISIALAMGNTKLVVLDHITSNTAMVLPIVEIASICQSHGAMVVIDAAHSLFTEDVRIYPRKVDMGTRSSPRSEEPTSKYISDVADIWIGNCHKWLCSPKGAAFMWISPRISHRIRPAIISHGFQLREQQQQSNGDDDVALLSSSVKGSSASDKLLSGFVWDGCRDYSALLTVPSILKFWNSFSSADNRFPNGMTGCRAYSRDLISQAVSLLVAEWKLEEGDFAAPPEMRQHLGMALVPLPAFLQANPTEVSTDLQAFRLQELLHHDYRIEVPVKCLEGKLYVRISAHIYNTIADFIILATTINKLR